MNIELTTDNLRKSCRVCLNQGELNIWEHTISVQDDEIFDSSRNSDFTALELFKIYENYDDTLLGLNDELKLLCYSCLDELTNSYIFYKKVAHTNKQIQRLYKEAQKIETEQLIEFEYIEVLDNECSNESNLFTVESKADKPEVEFVDETEAEVALDDYIEQISDTKEKQLVECSSPEQSLEFNAPKQATAVVTSEDTTDLSECDNEVIDESSVETPKEDCYDDNKPASVSKQYRSKPQRDKTTRSTGPTLPPHEDGSLIVTQFLPSAARIVLNTPNAVASTQEDEGGCAENIEFEASDLSTVDYAAVEVKSSNLQQIIEDELELQNTKHTSPEGVDSLDNYGNEQVHDSANTVYICKFCPQAFSAPHYLIAHVRKSHVCKYCTQAFAKSMDLFVHIRQAHHQHKCAICSKELSSHSNLRGHIKRVHGIRLPAQVALLDYRPPSGHSVEEKSYNTSTADRTLDETDMYF